jgi:hypothetical protein
MPEKRDPPGAGLRIPHVNTTWETPIMETIAPVLALGTLGFVAAFAYVSAREMDKRRQSGAPKSSLSRDGMAERIAATGVARR